MRTIKRIAIIVLGIIGIIGVISLAIDNNTMAKGIEWSFIIMAFCIPWAVFQD